MLEKQKKKLMAKLAELETGQETKSKANTATSKTKNNNVKVEQQKSSRKVQGIAAATADHWHRAALRREQLNEHDMGQILQEVEAGQCPEWKDIADCSPTYKSHWAQWNSLVLTDGVLSTTG
jgi:hypothetical protein